MTKARDIASAAPAPSTVSATELGYLDGVTSAIQTQLDAKVAKSLVDAKGDLLVGSANDTVSRLAIASTAGYVLTVDSAETTGMKWAAAAGGGKVLQVVQGTYATETSMSSSTYADTGLSASITPSATSSKILVLFTIYGGADNADLLNQGQYAIIRGSTNVWSTVNSLYTETALKKYLTVGGSYLDSPNTTSATTYKIQFRNSQRNGGVVYAHIGNSTSTIILMEIGA